ncbi:sulfatase [bacterium]|nr:sulfatase [bacterium]
MLSILYAALLAAGVLSAAEFLYILLSCGPFWLRPLNFFLTWGVYTLPILVGLCFVLVIASLVPFLRKWMKDPVRYLLFHYSIGLLAGGAALVWIIVKDLDTAAGIWLPIALILFFGFFTAMLSISVLQKKPESATQPLWIMIFLIIVVNGAVLFTDLSFAAKVKARSSVFQGVVPHLSLLVLDATRGDHFSSYGYPYNTTPNMDRIAAEGLRCQWAFSASNWSPPGHIAAFTGKYPSQHGNNGQPYTPDDLLTITEILRQEGYFCVALYNKPSAGRNINLTQGFDADIGVFRHSWVQPAWVRLRDKLQFKDSGSKATFPIALKTAKWIASKGGHLFLYLNLVEPHADYVIHEPYFTDLTQDLVFDHIPNLDEVQAMCASLEEVVYDSVKFRQYNRASYRYIEAVYDSEIAYLDAQFATFSNGMRESGLLDETMLVITADHGEFLGEHFTRGHPDVMYNPVLRIPLIFRYPAKIKPGVETGYTSNVDILPSVLAAMTYDHLIPTDVQGIDLLSDYPLQERVLLSESVKADGGSFAYFEPSYKLILNTDAEMLAKFPFDTLLFNLDIDPDELKDIRGKETERTRTMIESLNQWRGQIIMEPEE